MFSELGLEVPVEIKECALLLDIPTRYPDVFDEGASMDYYTSKDAGECIKRAEKILKWVEKNCWRNSKEFEFLQRTS